MTEQEVRQLVVEVAESWIGRKESDNTHKFIIDLYNSHKPLPRGYTVKYSDAWCATTISAIGVKLRLTDILLPECSCQQMVNLYKSAGRWEERDDYIPKIGDIVMYDWQDSGKGDNTGWPDHVGIICSTSKNTMRVIEGNINNAVGYRDLKIDGKYIRGYCLPDYASKAEKQSEVNTPPSGTYTVRKGDTLWSIAEKFLGDGTRYPELKKMNNLSDNRLKIGQVLKVKESPMITVDLPILHNGDSGVVVEVMQYLLFYHEANFSKYGPDGKFGNETESALIAFQKSNGLVATGVCDEKTWIKLLKG